MIFLRLKGTNCILLDTRYRVNCVINDYTDNIVILFSVNSVKDKELDLMLNLTYLYRDIEDFTKP